MSWMQKLYETYENIQANKENFIGESLATPPAHIEQQAHIEITLDKDGNFLSAEAVAKESTLLPATEASAGRTSGGEPHPLCDKIQYVAGDYPDYGGVSSSYFDDFKSGSDTKQGYLSLLSSWEKYSNEPMLTAVRKYVEKREVVRDLIRSKVLFANDKNILLTSWEGDNPPPIFKNLTKKQDKNMGSILDQGSALVRWKVTLPGVPEDRVWKNEALMDSWASFVLSHQTNKNLCYVSGEEMPFAVNHPSRIRHSGDKAKLISANDLSGFTFRGRFADAEECCTIGYDVTQKAHSALRWLIGRQAAFKNDTQVIVAWAVSNASLQKVVASTCEFFDDISVDSLSESENFDNGKDIGQEYSLKLKKKLAGYRAELKDRDDIVVMALDSATPGRMAITYYREIKGSDFLARLEDYHTRYAWRQFFGKDQQFIGAPAIDQIAKIAYAGKPSPELLKSTVSRLLPSVMDGAPIPSDLLVSVCRRASSPLSTESWEHNKLLGIACGLYAGSHIERGYQMSLEENRCTRDYLFGRLLAVADFLEDKALFVAGESRDTTAMKLMQKFSERPYSTWSQIEENLSSYMSRLKARRPKQLKYLRDLLDNIHAKFADGEYKDDKKLSPEYLLGYHCQRHELYKKKEEPESNSETQESKESN